MKEILIIKLAAAAGAAVPNWDYLAVRSSIITILQLSH